MVLYWSWGSDSLYVLLCTALLRLQQSSSSLGRANRKQYGGDHVTLPTRRRERELERRETKYHSSSCRMGARSTPVDARPAGAATADVENETSAGNRTRRQPSDLRRGACDEEDDARRWSSSVDNRAWTYRVNNEPATITTTAIGNENLRSTSTNSRMSRNYHHHHRYIILTTNNSLGVKNPVFPIVVRPKKNLRP